MGTPDVLFLKIIILEHFLNDCGSNIRMPPKVFVCLFISLFISLFVSLLVCLFAGRGRGVLAPGWVRWSPSWSSVATGRLTPTWPSAPAGSPWMFTPRDRPSDSSRGRSTRSVCSCANRRASTSQVLLLSTCSSSTCNLIGRSIGCRISCSSRKVLGSSPTTITTVLLIKKINFNVIKVIKRNPGFRSLRICADLQDFCRSLQICADLQDFCRSLQICADSKKNDLIRNTLKTK